MSTPVPGTYAQFPALEGLPALVRQQRRLEGRLVDLKMLEADEKATRQEIDTLLLAAGIGKGESVTCAGYDVTHLERAGSSRVNIDGLRVRLVAAGVATELLDEVIAASTETGESSGWATVKPSKGAQVRLPRDETRMAKATIPERKRA